MALVSGPFAQACGAASGQPISVSFVPAAAADVAGNGYASSGAFCMRLSHEKARVTTKTRGVISPLGEIIAHDVSFDPIVTWSYCLRIVFVRLDMFQSWGNFKHGISWHNFMVWLRWNCCVSS